MIAITGAAGFIGSNLAHRLNALGHDLLLVDHTSPEVAAPNWVGMRPHRTLSADQFIETLRTGAESPEAVFHLGACSSTIETDWDYLQRNNIGYTRHLWEWCAANARPLVYASSAATYGDGRRGFDDRTPPVELRPLNLYGKSKNDFDAWALAEVRAGRPTPAGWAGMKFFNVYGPRETHKGNMASVVYHAFRQVRSTGEVKLFRSNDPAYPDGGQRRDFVFVDDCIDHMLWLRDHPEASGVYNSGTAASRTFLNLAHAVFAALGMPPQVTYIDMPAGLSAQYQNFTQADMTKLRAAGCDAPATPLEQGVQATVEWLTANEK